MRVMFGSWKYLFKNLWYVLPFAIVPTVFLTLSLDYTAITRMVGAVLSGNPRAGFLDYFCALSYIETDVLGAVYNVCAFFSVALCMTLMLSLVEKHMRIGKRTPSGAFAGFGSLFFTAFVITFVYLAVYEAWAIVLSAVLFAVASVRNIVVVYLIDGACLLLFSFVLLYLTTVFYLWFPSRQMTGFGWYDSFLHSYRLMAGVRWKMIFSFLLSFAVAVGVVAGVSLLPELVFRAVTFVLFVFLFLNFGIRMETVYFETDKVDREDLIRSYREL